MNKELKMLLVIITALATALFTGIAVREQAEPAVFIGVVVTIACCVKMLHFALQELRESVIEPEPEPEPFNRHCSFCHNSLGSEEPHMLHAVDSTITGMCDGVEVDLDGYFEMTRVCRHCFDLEELPCPDEGKWFEFVGDECPEHPNTTFLLLNS
jgi:hypothetical protein